MSALQPIVAVLQVAAVDELLHERVPWEYAETLAAPVCSPRVLYVHALLVVSDGNDGVATAADIRVLYYRLLSVT